MGDQLEAGGPLVLVSNRGPVQFGARADGGLEMARGAGGLVTALSGLTSQLEDEWVWVCAAMTGADAHVASEHAGEPLTLDEGGRRHRVRLVVLDPVAYQRFYSVVANPLLWFMQHSLWDLSRAPNITAEVREAFENGYVTVNERFADVVAEEVERHGGRATVMLHDYHFYLVAGLVRARCPDAFLHHFVHIPWPQPDAWRILPGPMRDRLIRGLLANDVVAFHTEHYARNFLLTCQELLDLPVDLSDLSVQAGDRRVAARWYPISIDVAGFEALASSAEVLEHERRLGNSRREFLVVRVDRADLSKNILRGFLAFDRLLDLHPDLAGRVTFLALLQPSRGDVEEYAAYAERIHRLVADINLKHGHTEWQPIDLRFEDNHHQAVAAFRLYDALLVNPVVDGMNLVAKEGVLANQNHGVLVLSEHAGAHHELGAFALSVHPFDIDQQAEALFQALTLPLGERRDLHQACADVVRGNDLTKWFRAQLADISQLRSSV
ncbi:MAG: alpha,alpha-trehalose-phosphate synthase (UDP-forming) [Acidimicrobiales bacterium]